MCRDLSRARCDIRNKFSVCVTVGSKSGDPSGRGHDQEDTSLAHTHESSNQERLGLTLSEYRLLLLGLSNVTFSYERLYTYRTCT